MSLPEPSEASTRRYDAQRALAAEARQRRKQAERAIRARVQEYCPFGQALDKLGRCPNGCG